MKKFGFVVFAVVLSVLFVVFNNAIAREKVERGEIVAITYDDFLNKKSEVKYFFQRKDSSLVPLEDIGDSPPRPGQRATLSPNGKLHYSRNKASAGITFNRISGKKNILIALIQPSDEEIPWEAEEAEKYFQSSKNFFEDPCQHSDIELLIDIVGWKKSQKTKDELTNKTGDGFLNAFVTINEAIKLTDDDVDYSNVDCLFVVVADNNWTWTGAMASTGKSTNLTNDGYCRFSIIRMGSKVFSSSPYTNSHELGHAVLERTHGAGMNTVRGDRCDYQDGKVEEYGDPCNVMGSNYCFFPLWIQYEVGWLPEERITTLSGSASVELHPREIANSNGKQLIIIEINDSEFYTLELFVTGLESYNNNSIKNNLLLRYHGERIVTNNGAYDSFVFLQENNDNESFLQPGEEICGLGGKGDISIKYISLEGEEEKARAKVELDMPEPTPTPSPTPSPTPTPTPSPSPSPIPTPSPPPPPPSPPPTPTPTPCEAEIISISPGSMNIKKKTSGKVTVEVTSANGCAVKGEMVEAIVTSASGQKRITVSPSEGETDENGQVIFTITAQKKLGNGVVAFGAGNLETFLYVKVSKK